MYRKYVGKKMFTNMVDNATNSAVAHASTLCKDAAPCMAYFISSASVLRTAMEEFRQNTSSYTANLNATWQSQMTIWRQIPNQEEL